MSCDDVYLEGELLYKLSDRTLYTGKYERKRWNGHLVYEEHFKNGIIVSAVEYFNGKQKRVADSIVYNPEKPFIRLEEYRYNSNSQLIRKRIYSDDGKLKLKEEYNDGMLVYSCEYNSRKKHGKEFCYSKDGKPLEVEYVNGKKIRN